MPSAAGGVIDRLVGHSANYPPFCSLLPQISFRKLLSAFPQITNTPFTWWIKYLLLKKLQYWKQPNNTEVVFGSFLVGVGFLAPKTTKNGFGNLKTITDFSKQITNKVYSPQTPAYWPLAVVNIILTSKQELNTAQHNTLHATNVEHLHYSINKYRAILEHGLP